MSSPQSTIDPYATTGPPKRSQPQLLCEVSECGQRGTFNGQCYEHYIASLPDWQRNRATRNRPQPAKPSQWAANPVLAHAAPPKSSKLVVSRCAEFVASQGAKTRVVAIQEDRGASTPYVGSIPNLDTHTHDARVFAPSLRNWSGPDSRDTETILSEIAFAAFSRPWPDTTGPRNARVLAGLLRRGDLTVVIGLDKFAVEVGLNDWRIVKAALEDLAEEGWGSFELGDAEKWDPDGIEEPGKPSTFTLNPRTAPAGSFNSMRLPEPTLDLFTHGDGGIGSAGYLLFARLLVESRDETHPRPVVGIQDIIRLTGMTKWRAQRLLPKLAKVGHAEGNKVKLTLLDRTTETDRSMFDRQKQQERQKKLNARGLRRNEARDAHKKANKPPAPPQPPSRLDAATQAVEEPVVDEEIRRDDPPFLGLRI